jgi:hypothetical protein
MTDAEFEVLFAAAVNRAAELDYAEMPSDDEIDIFVQPSAQAQRKMKALLNGPNRYVRSLHRPIYLKAMRFAASFLITLMVLLGATMAVSPTVRAAVVDFVRSWFEDRTVYETPDRDLYSEWEFRYIPEGFELTDKFRTELHILYVYQDETASLLTITVSGEKQVVDNEHSEFYQATINGRLSDIYESNNPQYPSMIIIYDESSGLFITLVSVLDIAELIIIAENIN